MLFILTQTVCVPLEHVDSLRIDLLLETLLRRLQFACSVSEPCNVDGGKVVLRTRLAEVPKGLRVSFKAPFNHSTGLNVLLFLFNPVMLLLEIFDSVHCSRSVLRKLLQIVFELLKLEVSVRDRCLLFLDHFSEVLQLSIETRQSSSLVLEFALCFSMGGLGLRCQT